ncbi:hypothetical protein DEJ16_06895 [Curtobacterium sp. MCJR17_055]|nr:hypothetical protein DEI87_02650 [Curtobacterium sp. MCBD17_029]PYY57220.1 hypothetical protein DEJ16_06895 [Curtobacterium sp. MCJR17_055]PYY62430.1 hypothetical protein DEJ26_00630 [Curtobacterium sp. MCPF17_015]
MAYFSARGDWKVFGRSSRTASTSASSRTHNDPNELAKIHVWAMADEYEVAARGRIRQRVRHASDAAN